MTSLAGAAVLTTGADGGLGTEFVHQVLVRGAAEVDASARHPKAWDDDRIVPLALDATDAASVTAAAAAAVIDVASAARWRARGILAANGASKAAARSLTDSLREEPAPAGVEVLGRCLAFTDTPMTAGLGAPKGSPVDVVRDADDGSAPGALEVLAEEHTRTVRSELSSPLVPA